MTKYTTGLLGLIFLIANRPVSGQDCSRANLRCVGGGQEYTALQPAVDAAQPGDTVLAQPGHYAGFHTIRSGASGRPIVIRAGADTVFIDRDGPAVPYDSIHPCPCRYSDRITVEGTNNIVIEGFVVDSGNRSGISVCECRDVVLRDNFVRWSASRNIFSTHTPHIQLLYNRSYKSLGEHGIYISNGLSDSAIIRGNECWENSSNGIQLNGDCACGEDGLQTYCLLEDNIIHDNGYKGLSIISAPHTTIRNNLIYNNGSRGGAGGIHLVDEPGCNQPSNYSVVVNNTVLETRVAGVRMNVGATGCIIFNNIARGTPNIYDQVAGNFVDSSNDTTSALTALFVNSAGLDYRLKSGSPAIDAGVASYRSVAAPLQDRAGNSRPAGARYDVGAYEYTVNRIEAAALAETFTRGISAAPNPFNPATVLRYWVRTDDSRPALVQVSVYTLAGARVATLVNAVQGSGPHAVEWNAGGASSGMYLAVLNTGGRVHTRRLMLIK